MKLKEIRCVTLKRGDVFAGKSFWGSEKQVFKSTTFESLLFALTIHAFLLSDLHQGPARSNETIHRAQLAYLTQAKPRVELEPTMNHPLADRQTVSIALELSQDPG